MSHNVSSPFLALKRILHSWDTGCGDLDLQGGVCIPPTEIHYTNFTFFHHALGVDVVGVAAVYFSSHSGHCFCSTALGGAQIDWSQGEAGFTLVSQHSSPRDQCTGT